MKYKYNNQQKVILPSPSPPDPLKTRHALIMNSNPSPHHLPTRNMSELQENNKGYSKLSILTHYIATPQDNNIKERQKDRKTERRRRRRRDEHKLKRNRMPNDGQFSEHHHHCLGSLLPLQWTAPPTIQTSYSCTCCPTFSNSPHPASSSRPSISAPPHPSCTCN